MGGDLYDVAVVGYGPGGAIAAAHLGARGLRVLVLEQHVAPYPLPRAVTFDGEACRSIQATGADVSHALQRSTVLKHAPFYDPEGNLLFRLDWSGDLCGYAARRSIFQPDIEAALDTRIASFANVEVMRGVKVEAIAQGADGVTLYATSAGGKRHSFAAHYVVGADGANSFIRSALGIEVTRSGFQSALLNFDMEVLRPLPEHFSEFRMFMDPVRPHMFMPIGTNRMRFEFHVLPGDDEQALLREEIVWNWLASKHGLTREDVKLSRQVIYRYGSVICEDWRAGRAFLVGDAAHSMAPALGQGANSSIRDATNLSWKLAMVIQGIAEERLLDTYQDEMKPFVTELVMEAERIARFAEIHDPEAARARNEMMRQADTGPSNPWQWPAMQHGVFAPGASGRAAEIVGRLAPQGRLRRAGAIGKGDEVLGPGFQLICRHTPTLDASQTDFLAAIGCTVGAIEAGFDGSNGVEDLDGDYRTFLDRHQIDCYIMRPDFYVFGAGASNDAGTLVDALRSVLSFVGNTRTDAGGDRLRSEAGV